MTKRDGVIFAYLTEMLNVVENKLSRFLMHLMKLKNTECSSSKKCTEMCLLQPANLRPSLNKQALMIQLRLWYVHCETVSLCLTPHIIQVKQESVGGGREPEETRSPRAAKAKIQRQ